MNKRIYSLIALGALLFVACSDNSSPVSGSTSVPNMGNNLNNLRSPVLCSVAGVKDSLEAVEKGVYGRLKCGTVHRDTACTQVSIMGRILRVFGLGM